MITGGFAGGAKARARTLHEIAVVAEVIAKHGRQPGTDTIAERYLDHSVIGDLAICEFDASLYEERESKIPSELSKKIAELKQLVAQLVEQHGQYFDAERGWAIPLLGSLPANRRGGKKCPSIADLEFLADESNMRMTYGLMSAEVHAGADGLVHNLDPLAEGDTYIGPASQVGPHMIGLAEPGRHACVGLHNVTWALLTSATGGELTQISDLLALRTLEAMYRRYVDTSDTAEDSAHAWLVDSSNEST